MTPLENTIVAPATLPGTGAITVIRLAGPDAFALADKVFRSGAGSLSDAPGGVLRHGFAVSEDGSVLDEVVVSLFRAPHSYTGEDCVEFSCHASPYVASALVSRLCALGARCAEAGEFTRRAFLNGKMDLAQAESVADIIAAESSSQLRLAMNQLRGGYSKELKDLRESLLELTALLELELDFSEEEVEFASRSKLELLCSAAAIRCRSLADSFRIGNAVRTGIPVAIAGEPNSGKSTLLNTLLGDDRAIVTDIPGTTRDTLEETCVVDGLLFRFIDTAGIRESADKVETLGIERTFKKISQAQIVLYLVDLTLPLDAIRSSVGRVMRLVDFSCQKLVILANKADLVAANKDVNNINDIVLSFGLEGVDVPVIKLSAKSGEGFDNLRKELVSGLSERLSSSVLVTNARHASALSAAADSLEAVRRGLSLQISGDLLAEDLRDALRSLGTITGEVTTDEVLGTIFSRFCIGK